MDDYRELKESVDQIELVDAHAHNIVALDSSFPFIGTFSEATGDALSFAPHSLSFKVPKILDQTLNAVVFLTQFDYFGMNVFGYGSLLSMETEELEGSSSTLWHSSVLGSD